MIKLTDSEKLERKLWRMFQHHFRNYKLNFTLCEGVGVYTNESTYLMFLAYQAGYNKGKVKSL
jgi:hypothetical protein